MDFAVLNNQMFANLYLTGGYVVFLFKFISFVLLAKQMNPCFFECLPL
jgi:hypothetical protein